MTTATRNGFSCNLFNISGNTTLQDYKQEILNPYTILGFKDKNDFESQINELCDSNRKQLRDKLWSTFEKQIEKDRKNSKAARNVDNTIGKTRNIESKLNNVLTLKKQVQAFFEDQHNKNITPNAIDPQEVDVKLFNRPLNKPINKRKIEKKASITSNWQDYEQILKYIESLEEEIGITLEELKEHKENSAKTFLLNRVNLLNKKYPKSQNERKSAVKVLADEKLRAAYDRLQDKALRPLISYKECRNLYDKMNQMKNESKSIIKREEREKNLKKIDKSIVSAINDIKKHREAILNCKDFQSSYIKEKKEHPFRGNACQKMIDIYQERIVGYQEKIRQNLNQIKAILKSTPQEMDDVEELEEIIDGMHEAKQFDEDFDSALICLLNIQNKLDVQLENPPTELRVSHINVKTEVTRL